MVVITTGEPLISCGITTVNSPTPYSLNIVIPKELVELGRIKRGDRLMFKLAQDGKIIVEKVETVKKIGTGKME